MMSSRIDGRTYEVDCNIVPVRKVAVAVHGQECVGFDLALVLCSELLGRDLSHGWLAVWNLHFVVGVVSHFSISLEIIEISKHAYYSIEEHNKFLHEILYAINGIFYN